MALIQKDRFCPDTALIMYLNARGRKGEWEHGTFRELWPRHVYDSPFILFTAVYSPSNMCKCTLYFLSSRFLSFSDARMQEPAFEEAGYWRRERHLRAKLSDAARNIDTRLFLYCHRYFY